MTTNIDKYRSDLKSLIELGERMSVGLLLPSKGPQEPTKRAKKQPSETHKFLDEYFEKARGSFEREYQRWYTEASAVIRQLIPNRSAEFEYLYKGDGKRKDIDIVTYTIQDWLNGVRAGSDRFTGEKVFDDQAVVSRKFETQLRILESVEGRFASTLFDIRQLVKADLLDSEIETARELIKCGFTRGAGVIAGVVLEKHLAEVSANHSIVTRKKHPTISEYNDLLKNASVIDVPIWRQIQRLGDIRNLCGHSKERESTTDEVEELINGVEKITKTLF